MKQVTRSIPSIIPDLNHPIFDPDGKCRRRLVSRSSQRLASFDREPRAVTWADNLVILNATTGQSASVMSADIFDSIKRLVKFEYRNCNTVYFHMHRLADGDGLHAPNLYPSTHTTSTSISGSMVRARLPIAISVPARELGQLPHAPK